MTSFHRIDAAYYFAPKSQWIVVFSFFNSYFSNLCASISLRPLLCSLFMSSSQATVVESVFPDAEFSALSILVSPVVIPSVDIINLPSSPDSRPLPVTVPASSRVPYLRVFSSSQVVSTVAFRIFGASLQLKIFVTTENGPLVRRSMWMILIDRGQPLKSCIFWLRSRNVSVLCQMVLSFFLTQILIKWFS